MHSSIKTFKRGKRSKIPDQWITYLKKFFSEEENKGKTFKFGYKALKNKFR